MLDELVAAWPPAEELADSGYLRPSLAAATPIAATGLRPHGEFGLAVVVARLGSGRLMLAPLVRAGTGWRRARPRDGASAALVETFATGATLDDGFLVRQLAPVAMLPGERAIGVDQTNESVVVGGTVVVKWLAQPALRPPTVPDLQAHLAAVGYAGVPRPLGSLVWSDAARDQAVLAFLTEWLPDARDGWDWCVQDLLEHVQHGPEGCVATCPARSFPAALGRLTAGLHVALATASPVIPEPDTIVDRRIIGGWGTAAMTALDTALELLQDGAGALLRTCADTLRSDIASMDTLSTTRVQHIHGDLHVGQVLTSTRGLAVIDLDDDISIEAAERGRPLPAARDVAQLTCSLDHVGRMVDLRTGGTANAVIERWIGDAQGAMLDAYRAGLAGAGRPDLLDERLLRPLIAERTCVELLYATRVLPRWLYAPLGTLGRMASARRNDGGRSLQTG